MSGTSEGAKKGVITKKVKYGLDHYEKIGSEGGKKSRGGGFTALSKDELLEVARKGGKAKKGWRKAT